MSLNCLFTCDEAGSKSLIPCTVDLRRISTRKKIATLAKVPDEGHDYDYVTTTGHPGDNEYDMVNRTPLPALTSRAQTSSVVPATDYEVPVQSFPHKNGFGQQLKHSSPAQYYEATLSSTSVKLEVGKVCLRKCFCCITQSTHSHCYVMTITLLLHRTQLQGMVVLMQA